MSRPTSVRRRVAPWVATVAAAATIAACSDDDDGTAATSSVESTTVIADAQPTAALTTTTPLTSLAAASSTAQTTAPTAATTEPPATAAPSNVALSGETLEVTSSLMTNPFLLERVGVFGGLVVYDGESIDGDFVLRCIAIGHDGETTWSEWCALPGDSSSFVVVEGINPWVVDVGAEHLDVTMTQMPSDWAVTSSGCTDPMVILIDAAEVSPAVATSIGCAGGEAFMSYSSVFMQPGPPDGGGLLLTSGDEGWNAGSGGTSVPCGDFPDGVDRCAPFGVDEEMAEATSPIPTPEQLAAQQDYVAVREVTGDVQAMAADAPDLEAMTEAIVAALTPAEGEPAVTRHDEVYFNQYSLLVVDVPAADDSIGSTTWAVWITTETPEVPSTVHRAYAWENCTRGRADSETCV